MHWQTRLYRMLGEGEFSHDPQPFYDPARLPQLAGVRDAFSEIRDEFMRLPQSGFVSIHGNWTPQVATQWRIYPLMVWGKALDEHRKHAPVTLKALEGVPGVMSAMFSVLRPHTVLRPHRGLPYGILRAHMGLFVPPECGLRVSGVTREWHEGEWLVFDDTCLHSAWNNSDQVRVILMIDVLRDETMKPLHRVVNEYERARHLIDVAIHR